MKNYSDTLKEKALRLFKVGTAVYDEKFDEVFRFDVSRDSYVIANYPELFRKATWEEIKQKMKHRAIGKPIT